MLENHPNLFELSNATPATGIVYKVFQIYSSQGNYLQLDKVD